jgi:hypothetical protein
MKTRTRVLIFVAVFIVLSGIFAYASSIHLSSSDAQSLNQGVESINGTVVGIYTNNVQIALLEFVPVFGPGMGVYSSYDTGLALAGIAQSSGTGISGPEFFIFLLFTPIFWIEFACYSLAVEESIAVIISFKNGDFRTREWKWLLGSIIFVVVALFVSAGIEVDMINFIPR